MPLNKSKFSLMIFKSKIHQISSKKKKLPTMDGLRDYVGKKVFSKSGDPIGKVHDLMITKLN